MAQNMVVKTLLPQPIDSATPGLDDSPALEGSNNGLQECPVIQTNDFKMDVVWHEAIGVEQESLELAGFKKTADQLRGQVGVSEHTLSVFRADGGEMKLLADVSVKRKAISLASHSFREH